MMKRKSILFTISAIVFLFFGTISTSMAALTHKATKDEMITTSYQVPFFNSLDIQDGLDIQIISGQKQQSIVAIGKPSAVRNLHMRVENHTLMIGNGFIHSEYNWNDLFHHSTYQNGMAPKVSAIIIIKMANLQRIKHDGPGYVNIFQLNTPSLSVENHGSGTMMISGPNIGLSNLVNTGSGMLTIRGVKSSSLRIHDQGTGTVALIGVQNLEHLDMTGSGILRMYWIKSRALSIKASGQSRIILAGICRRLFNG